MSSLESYGYGRIVKRLRDSLIYAEGRLIDEGRSTEEGHTAYERFLERLGDCSSVRTAGFSGLVCLSGMVLQLQLFVFHRLIKVAHVFLHDARRAGTREDEDGVYGSLSICRYVLHHMPGKRRHDALKWKTELTQVEQIPSKADLSDSIPVGRHQSGTEPTALHMTQVTWIRAMETLEAHALICVVAVSLKLCRGANTDNLAISYRNTVYQQFVLSPSSGGFSLPNEAMRVLEDTLQEFSQRLSAPQKARVWHALARIKSISDPIGCIDAYQTIERFANPSNSSWEMSLYDNGSFEEESEVHIAPVSCGVAAYFEDLVSSSTLRLRHISFGSANPVTREWIKSGYLGADDQTALAVAYATIGNISLAVNACEAAIQLSPGRAELYMHLAGALQLSLGRLLKDTPKAHRFGNWPKQETIESTMARAATTLHGARISGLSGMFLVMKFGFPSGSSGWEKAKKHPEFYLRDEGIEQFFDLTVEDYYGKEKETDKVSNWKSTDDRHRSLGGIDSGNDAIIWRRVISAYETAMELDPMAMSALTFYLLGLGHLYLNERGEALAAFQTAAGLDASSVDALLQMAVIMDLEAHSYTLPVDPGLDSSDEGVADNTHTSTFRKMGNRNHFRQAALDAYQRASMAILNKFYNSEDQGALFRSTDKVSTQLRHGGLSSFESSQSKIAGFVEVQLRIGHLALAVGDRNTALRAFGRAFILDDTNGDAKHGLAALHGDVAMNLFCAGTSAIKRCEFSVAKNELKEALLLKPEWIEAKSALSYVLKWIGNHIEALSVGNDINNASPNNKGIWFMLASSPPMRGEHAKTHVTAGGDLSGIDFTATTIASTTAFFKLHPLLLSSVAIHCLRRGSLFEAASFAEQASFEEVETSGSIERDAFGVQNTSPNQTSPRSRAIEFESRWVNDASRDSFGNGVVTRSLLDIVDDLVDQQKVTPLEVHGLLLVSIRCAATPGTQSKSNICKLNQISGPARVEEVTVLGAVSSTLEWIVDAAESWTERNHLSYAAVAFESVLREHHMSGGIHSTSPVKVARVRSKQEEGGATRKSALMCFEPLSAKQQQQNAERLPHLPIYKKRVGCVNKFGFLPAASRFDEYIEESQQRCTVGDFDGAVRKLRSFVYLKPSNHPSVLLALVNVSRLLRQNVLLNKAAEVCRLVQSSNATSSAGNSEAAEVHTQIGDRLCLHSVYSSLMSMGSAQDIMHEDKSAVQHAYGNAAVMTRGESVEAVHKLAGSAVYFQCGHWRRWSIRESSEFNANMHAMSLPTGKAQLHFKRAQALSHLFVHGLTSEFNNCTLDISAPAEEAALDLCSSLALHVHSDLARGVYLSGPAVPVNMLFALSETCAKLGDHAGAARHLAAAVARNPGGEHASYAGFQLGSALCHGENTSDAVAAIENASRCIPTHPNAALCRRKIRVSHGRALIEESRCVALSTLGAAERDRSKYDDIHVKLLEMAVAALSLAAGADQMRMMLSSNTLKSAAHEGIQLQGEDMAHRDAAEAHSRLGSAYYAAATHLTSIPRKELSVSSIFVSSPPPPYAISWSPLQPPLALRRDIEQLRLAVRHNPGLDGRVCAAAACRAHVSISFKRNGANVVADGDDGAALSIGIMRLAGHACSDGAEKVVTRLTLGKIAEDHGCLGDAVRAYRAAIAASAPSITIAVSENERISHILREDAEYALSVLTTNLSKRVTVLQADATLSSTDGDVSVNLGKALEALGDDVGAIGAYQASLRTHPDHPDHPQTLFALASCYYRQRNVSFSGQRSPSEKGSEARDIVAQKLNLDLLSDAVIYYRRAAILQAESAEVQGATGLACVTLQQAIDADSNSHSIRTTKQAPGDRELAWREASEALQVACELSPGFVKAFEGLSICKEALDEMDAARALLTHAIDLSPCGANILERLGRLNMTTGGIAATPDWDSAASLLIRAAKAQGLSVTENLSVAITTADAAEAYILDTYRVGRASTNFDTAAADLLQHSQAKVFERSVPVVMQMLSRCFLKIGEDLLDTIAHGMNTHGNEKGEIGDDIIGSILGSYSRAVAADPFSAAAHCSRANARKRLWVVGTAEDHLFASESALGTAKRGYSTATAIAAPDTYAEALAGQASVIFHRGRDAGNVDGVLKDALKGFKAAMRHGYNGLSYRAEMGEILTGHRRLLDAAVVFRSILDDIKASRAGEQPFGHGEILSCLRNHETTALTGLANVRVLQGRILDAANCFASIVTVTPSDLQAKLQHGLCLRSTVANEHRQPLSANRFDTASNLSHSIHVQKHATWQEVEKVLVSALYQTGDTTASLVHAAACAAEAPTLFVPTCMALGEAQVQLDRPMQAMAIYGLALRFQLFSGSSLSLILEPRLASPIAESPGAEEKGIEDHYWGPGIIEPLYQLGQLNLSLNQFDVASQYLEYAHDAIVSTATTVMQTSKFDGVCTGLLGRLLEIRELHSHALARLVGSYAALAQDDATTALGYLKIAAELDSTSPVPPYQSGLLLFELYGDAKGALTTQRAALEIDSRLVSSHMSLAICLEATGDVAGAVESYEAGIMLSSKESGQDISVAHAYTGLGDSLAAMAKLKSSNYSETCTTFELSPSVLLQSRAMAAYRCALDIDQYNMPTLRGAALCLVDMQKFEVAVACFRNVSRPRQNNNDIVLLSAYGVAVVCVLDRNRKSKIERQRNTSTKKQAGKCIRSSTPGTRLCLDSLDEPPPELVLPLSEEALSELWGEGKQSLELVIQASPKRMAIRGKEFPQLAYDTYIALATVRAEVTADSDGALILIEKAIAIDATRASAHVAIGRVLLSKGSAWIDDCITALLTAYEHIVVKSKRSGDAARSTDNAVRTILPESAELLSVVKSLLTTCYLQKGDTAMLNPEMNPSLASSSGAIPVELANDEQRHVVAEGFYRDALRYDSQNFDARGKLAAVLFERALLLENRRFSPATAAGPKSPTIQHSREVDDAIAKLYAAALSFQPDFGAAYYRMGLALERQGLFEEAIACEKKAVKCSPELVGGHQALSRLFSTPEEIIGSLAAAALIKSTDFSVMVQYGAGLTAVGRFQEALDAGRAATNIAPARYEALVMIGDAAEGSKDFTLAAAAFEEAVALLLLQKKQSLRLEGTKNTARIGSESARKEQLLNVFRKAAAPFGAKSGWIDHSDLMPLADALGFTASSLSLQELRHKIAAESKTFEVTEESTKVSMRTIEAWWLAHGKSGLPPFLPTMSLEKIEYINDQIKLLDELQKGPLPVDLGGLYLKLGTAYCCILADGKELGLPLDIKTEPKITSGTIEQVQQGECASFEKLCLKAMLSTDVAVQ